MEITRYSCHILVTFEFFSTEFKKIMKYQISRNSIQLQPSYSVRTDRQTQKHDESNSDFSKSCGSAKNLFFNLRFEYFCISPKANLKLRCVSVSVLIGLGAVMAVLGAIKLLVSICLIIGAQKVSNAFTVLSAL
jgi:hypothetical protein